MSNTKNTGGAAFPAMGEHNTPKGPNYVWNEGMDLRDYFAAKAMQGLLANSGGPIQQNPMSGWGFTNCEPSDVAQLCYKMADAMIKAKGDE
jgi:hypothetical protein